jgi:hypothetical protein
VYKYKVTILNSVKHNKKAVTRYLHHFNDKFRSVTDLRVRLLEELSDDLSGTINFDIGYYEARSSKLLVVTSDDLKQMYEHFKAQEDIQLWCDAVNCDGDKSSASDTQKGKKRRREPEKSSEDDVDTIYQELKEKHKDKYTIPQLRLWARMIHCGTHDGYDNPPAVPMFSGTQPKRPRKESLADTIAESVAAFSKAFGSNSPAQSSTSSPTPTLGLSPGKSIDLRMKNLQQLRYIQQLFEDNILSEPEFLEQKKNILESLRKLNQ